MSYAYSHLAVKNVANVSTDRIFKLSPIIENQIFGKRSTFNIDKFKNTELHAIQDSGLWYLSFKTPEGYGAGSLPEPLKQRWTNFNQLRKFLDSYFASRNIKVDEVIS